MQVRQTHDTTIRRHPAGALMLLVGGAGLFLASGCSTPLRTVRPDVSPDTLSDAAFVHYLAATSVVTVDEGARAVLSVISDEASSSDDSMRRDALIRRDMIRDDWGLVSNSVLDRGTFAFLLCRGLELPRSFNEWVAQRTGIGERRSALATAVYEKLLAYGPAHEPISGGEVVDALVRAEQWSDNRRGNSGTSP